MVEISQQDVNIVKAYAKRVHRRREFLDLDSIISDALLGLTLAAQTYDSNRLEWAVYRDLKARNEVVSGLRDRGGRSGDKLYFEEQTDRLDKPFDEKTLIDTIIGSEPNETLAIIEILTKLPERHRFVLQQSALGIKDQEIAEELQVSTARVQQIRRAAKEQLNHPNPPSKEPKIKFVQGYLGEGEILTTREKEILVLSSLGKSCREIAKMLFISMETVRSHRRRIFRKLGAVNTANALLIAVETGEINIPTKAHG